VTFIGTLLWPLSLAYGLGARLRVRLYRAGIFRQHKLKGVVISVGNLSVGGTGKTPMVLWLAERLLAEGKHVAVLTRGYRGFLKGSGTSKGAAPDSLSSTKIGDEPELLQRRIASRASSPGAFRVAVGPDRVATGQQAERDGFNWLLLDDGFQHFKLARDLDVVLIDGTRPLGGERVLPSGRLREPKSALSRADIVVISRSTHAPAIEAVVRRFTSAPIFYAMLRLDAVVHAGQTADVLKESEWESRRFFAYCGIGNPASFLDNLREWRFTIVGSLIFPDHHLYTRADRQRLEAAAKSCGADALICTEKDIYNFGAAWASALPVFYARVSLEMQNAGAFWTAAHEILQRRRPEIFA
jgi:tetraacyldisaccharide 4'-kinase